MTLIKSIVYAIITLSLLFVTFHTYNSEYDRTVVVTFAAGTGLGILLSIDELLNSEDIAESVLFVGMIVLLLVAVIAGTVAARRRRDSA
ncbi:hypothetical protein HTG_16140 [Natrinema mahii]|nr:hypothetical protein HTG_16140 [Natrinema mahii]